MSDFIAQQQRFMKHIRHGDSAIEIDSVEDRRMAIYRDLFFNNIDGFVSASFVVLKSLYSCEAWQKLVREFFIEHDCSSPYFVDISKSFVHFLSEQRTPQASDFPFLTELAHYEWVELEVSIRHEKLFYALLPEQLELEQTIVLSELAWPLTYAFPVHQISEDYQPAEPVAGGVHLVVYRDVEEEVQFMQINAVTGVLLQLLQDNAGISIGLLVETLVEALPQFAPEQIQTGALQMVSQLAQRGIIRSKQIAEVG